MGEQGTPAGSRKPLCQGEGRRSVQTSEETAGMSMSAYQVPVLDRRGHGERPGEGCCHAGKCQDWAEMPAPGRLTSQHTSDNPQIVFDSHCHLPSLGFFFFLLSGSQGSTIYHLRDVIHSTEKRNEFRGRR